MLLATAWEGMTSSAAMASIATGQETSAEETRLREELSSYAKLANNWNGEGAKPALAGAVKDALKFLDGRPADIPLPHPEEGSEGEIGVYWDYGDVPVFAEVSFEGDGSYAYFAVYGTPKNIVEKCGKDEMDVAAPWPSDMVRLLRNRQSS